jgi:hypothetical protein
MRCERQPNNEDAETTGYTFHFQIANDGGRQAFSVKVQAPNVQDCLGIPSAKLADDRVHGSSGCSQKIWR